MGIITQFTFTTLDENFLKRRWLELICRNSCSKILAKAEGLDYELEYYTELIAR